MSALLLRQQEFSAMLMRLLSKAHALGFFVTMGDCFRDPRCPYGSPKSLHRQRLAVDLNLFRDGEYLTTVEDHRPLGEWWESIGWAWGGRFREGPMAGDANHYSLEWEGRR